MISPEETRESLYHEPQRVHRNEAERERRSSARIWAERMHRELGDDLTMEDDPRPDWDYWFITLCFVIAQRSLDKDTKHGCVVVDDSRTILSVGYNGPPRGCADAFVPLERPDKYDYMKHSEENAIINAARTGVCLKGSIFYITGPPCHGCFGDIINVGAKKIIHGSISSAMVNAKVNEVIEFMKINRQGIDVIELKDMSPVSRLLSKTQTYIAGKIGEKCE